jgi:Uncharacterized protein conserved in bacteria (DUF2130)
MEAATPLFATTAVRVLGDRLLVDGLVVDDECAVRQAREAEDPGRFVRDAVEIGARVLDREQTEAGVEVFRIEAEKAEAAFAEKARAVAQFFNDKVDEALKPESGSLSRELAKHFSDDSSGAVQHRVKAAIEEVMAKSRDELRRQFAADDPSNPLAGFQRQQLAVMRQAFEQQSAHLRAMAEQLTALQAERERERAEKDAALELAAERDRGTAKGRSFEELVAEAIDALALPQGDVAEAVGDLKESTGKKGDVVVQIGACQGPARGRIVFEAKNSKMTRPKALEELDLAKAERGADYAVLVVSSEEKVPAKMQPLREYNGDKLIVAYDADEGPLALQVAYALARSRVLMVRGGEDEIDAAAVRDTVERALGAMEDVRRVKQQLTGAKTQIDKAAEIVDAMAGRVRAHLAEIDELLAGAGDLAEDAPEDADE